MFLDGELEADGNRAGISNEKRRLSRLTTVPDVAGKRGFGGVLFLAKQREDAFLLILNRLLTRSPLFLGTWIGSSLLKDVL